MVLRFSEERLRALVLVGGVFAAASSSVACGDDDNAGSSSGKVDSEASSSGTTTPTPTPQPTPTPTPTPNPTPDAGPTEKRDSTFDPDPATGPFTSSVPKRMFYIETTTPNATIFDTTNGTDPTTSSTVYTGAISVTETTTIRALAVATGFRNSAIASATYTISKGAGSRTALGRAYRSGHRKVSERADGGAVRPCQ